MEDRDEDPAILRARSLARNARKGKEKVSGLKFQIQVLAAKAHR